MAVEIERIAVALRPRTQWEALDLGFQMAREWWRPIWGVWLALYLPAAAFLLLVIPEKFYAVLALFWLKPLFDRAVLHTASRAVFGEECGVKATLRSYREWLKPGLISALTFGRFDLARSFTMPVSTLEKQTGFAARRRRSALGSRTRGSAVWLTVVCLHLEWVALFATVIAISMLEPTAADLVPDEAYDEGVLDALREMFQWSTKDALHYILAVSLVEPFYVTAGFSLYLNRRVILEGWDIEVQLRRIEERLSGAAKAALLVLALTLGSAAFVAMPQSALAQQEGKSPQHEIAEVLASPEFNTEREVKRWRYLGEIRESESKPLTFSDSMVNFIRFISDISQGLLWALAIIAVLLIVYALHRFAPEPSLRRRAYRPPDTLFGLDVAPESLPDDVAAAALAALRDGRSREALSLLYRGALSALVHRYEVPLLAGYTEGDCVRAARGSLPEPGVAYFRQLVGAWQAVAYASQTPPAAGVEQLCGTWSQYFAKPIP